MSLNWKEIDCILSELPLVNSRVQQVIQGAYHSITLELYHPEKGRWRCYISLAQQTVRMHELTFPRTMERVKLQRFAQLLRSHIVGARIGEAVQLGNDRIVRIILERGGEELLLYIRLWGGAGNIILCSRDGTILDACFRRPKRGEVSGELFNPEPVLSGSGNGTYEVRPRIPGSSFNEQIDREYWNRELSDRCRRLSQRIRTLLDDQEARLLSKLHTLEQQQLTQDGSRTRELADLLASNIHLVKSGDTRIEVHDFYHDNTPVIIPLDGRLEPGAQVEAYYRRASREKRALEHHREEGDAAIRDLREIRHQRADLLNEEGTLEERIARMQSFLAAEAPARRRAAEPKEIPGLQFRSGIHRILVGRTARDNEELLRRHTRGNDWWLHARDYPGAYVFIKGVAGKSVPLETLLDAAVLALYYSKGRQGGKGDIYCTQVKYLRRVKHGKPGQVIPTQEKNLSVHLEPERLERLLGGTREA